MFFQTNHGRSSLAISLWTNHLSLEVQRSVWSVVERAVMQAESRQIALRRMQQERRTSALVEDPRKLDALAAEALHRRAASNRLGKPLERRHLRHLEAICVRGR